MKTKLVGITLASMMVLAACSNGTNSSSSAPGATSASTSAAAQKVTISYGIWDKNYQPAVESIIKKFNETHPNIEVKIELTPWEQYWPKLETAAVGNSLTDVFWMNGPNVNKYASNKLLKPLDDQIVKSKVDLSNFPKGLTDLYTIGGKSYGIPFELSTVGLWYNKDLFKAANIPFPDASWDWNKLRDAAKKLTDPAKGVWGIAAPMANQQGFYNTILQNNGFVISDDKKTSGYDKPEAIEGLKFWTDMIKEGVSPTAAQMTETQPEKLFESGKVAMIYDGSWIVGEFAKIDYTKDKADVTVLPKGKSDTSVIHGVANVINAETKHPNEAWEFLNFLSSKDAALLFAQSGAVIPAFNGTQDDWVKKVPNFNLRAFIDMIPKSKAYPVSKSTAKWLDVENEFFTQAWYGKMTVEEAGKQAAAKMNSILSKE
ncbi:sugar ABC transporter substrate-binding protein [Paenibacillus sp. N3.4]|uniref:ABC transporter substrate-binding protein n=1 Tax=Paenibacillus sp. N3.4 TaxID=2603222 RepID=UPI0011CA8E35|nr:sugar ABC transporter substrate-binding protein [Paenibacillus sp. N3.4]TXK85043.1 sugar ABC transporter substrate-binding protein [Paenibacillus sp. N3.4]